MLQSIITSKGQTTIPKEIRNLLKLKPQDKLYYLIEDGKVVLKPIHGDILQLKGSVRSKERSVDFEQIRAATRKKVAKKIVEGD
jgi:AbrB family looped-hinge helix DNA binding protein